MTPLRPAYFDPLSTIELTAQICRKFEEQPSVPLAEVPPFDGAGLYAIYYTGSNNPLYRPLRGYLIPVYVGSAQFHSSATGRTIRSRVPLHLRVREHQRSIGESDLDIGDFAVRLLLMPDVHIDLGENGLRVGYKPVWNSVLRGFGSHEQGAQTRTSAQTIWDSVHAGRARTHGRPRDAGSHVAMAAKLIELQVAACGTRRALDWTHFDPDAIPESAFRPRRSPSSASEPK